MSFKLGDEVKVAYPEKYANNFKGIFKYQVGVVIGFCSVHRDSVKRVAVSFKKESECDCYCEYLFMEHDLEKVRAENV